MIQLNEGDVVHASYSKDLALYEVVGVRDDLVLLSDGYSYQWSNEVSAFVICDKDRPKIILKRQ
jgi:hypothetical protein